MEQTVGDVGGDFTKTVIVESAGPEGDVQAGIEFIYHMREHLLDIGVATVSIDNIEATRDYGSYYEELHRNFYTIDRANRRIVLDETARATVRNSLIKLTGVKKPTLLTADSTSCDIEPEYIIQKTTAMALLARSDRSSERREAAQLDSERMNLLAEQTLAKSQTPQRCVWID